MPYITQESRPQFEESIRDLTDKITGPGELNYVITRLVRDYIKKFKLGYAVLNAAIGVLECAKLELYRRLVVDYEGVKIKENGDVI